MSDKEKDKDTMSLFLQKQPYNLTMAKHNLGIHQMRIIVRTIEALQPFMSMDVDYEKTNKDAWVKVRVSDLAKTKNVRPIRDALDGLMKKIVRIMHFLPEEGNYLEIGTPIIQSYKYKHGSQTVDLKIGAELIPQITDLARGYTKYSLQVAFNTSSPKVMKMYQYIAHFRDKKQIRCDVETLRKWMQIEDKYSKPKDIKKRILEPAMRELKAKADVWFDIAERIKDGRRMLGWKFNIYTKKSAPKKEVKTLPQAPQKTKNTSGIRPPHPDFLENTMNLSSKQVEKIIAFFNKTTEEKQKKLRKIIQEIQYAILDKRIHTSIGGYVVKSLNESFKGDLKL